MIIYTMLCAKHTDDLDYKVNEALSDGYDLYGEAFAVPNENGYIVFQPMVRDEEDG